MNPFAAWLLDKVCRRLADGIDVLDEWEDALNVFGYWIIHRAEHLKWDDYPPCKITQECTLVAEFKIGPMPEFDMPPCIGGVFADHVGV